MYNHFCTSQKQVIWHSHPLRAVNGKLCRGETGDNSLSSSGFSFLKQLLIGFFVCMYNQVPQYECLPGEKIKLCVVIDKHIIFCPPLERSSSKRHFQHGCDEPLHPLVSEQHISIYLDTKARCIEAELTCPQAH